MSNVDRSLWITYNGEIYNFTDLRTELGKKGHVFRSQTDTEVVLSAYQQWGVEAIDRFSGIFAFALWDERNELLLLARDPVGVKPLFYYDNGSKIIFASEVKAIFKDRAVPREINPEGLDAFFSFSYCPSPITGFRHIQQVSPGEWLIYNRKGKKKKKYWQIACEQKKPALSFSETSEKFDELLTEIVKKQMVSDVPLGGFLSGGLDSTAIVRAMKKVRENVSVFNMGFNNPCFDEGPFAEKVAKHLGASLIKQRLTVKNAINILQEISKYTEEPIADSSMLGMYVLCKAAKEHLTVVLSGDGADELLAGYDTYRASHFAHYYRNIPNFLREHAIAVLAKRIPVSNKKYNLHQIINRFINGAREGNPRDHCCWRVILNNSLKESLYSADFREETKNFDPFGLYENFIHAFPGTKKDLNRLLYADLAFYLPNDILVKVDRMSMANGLEVRVPFLDKELVNFCMQLPVEYKLYKGRIKKYILRKILSKSIPKDVINRPKSGFNVPVEDWMRQKDIVEFFMDSLNNVEDRAANYLNLDQIKKTLCGHVKKTYDNGHLLFTVLIFFLWLKNIKEATYGNRL